MRVLVTGSAGGLGSALVDQLLLARHVVIGVDSQSRSNHRLQSVDTGSLSLHCADLTDNAAIDHLVDAVAASGPVDVVIHCAAVNATGRFDTIAWESQSSTIQLNLRAPMILTATLLHRRLIASGGTLIFIGSLSSYVSYPGASVYAATKDGLLSYARSLSVELAPSNIRCLSVLPGPLRTAHAARHAPPGTKAYNRLCPKAAAGMILNALSSRRKQLIPGYRAKFFWLLSILAPRSVQYFMRTRLYVPLTSHRHAP